MIGGEEVPSQTVLKSQLLVRQSCGCPSRSLSLATAEAAQEGQVDQGKLRESMAAQLSLVMGDLDQARMWATRLMDAFQGDMSDGAKSSFLQTLDGMLQQRAPDRDETVAWHAAIALLRRWSVSAFSEHRRLQAEDLFGQARLIVGEAAQRTQIARQLQAERQAETLREIGQALITTFDVDRLADVLAERLPRKARASSLRRK